VLSISAAAREAKPCGALDMKHTHALMCPVTKGHTYTFYLLFYAQAVGHVTSVPYHLHRAGLLRGEKSWKKGGRLREARRSCRYKLPLAVIAGVKVC
jgi:hypothetical protein